MASEPLVDTSILIDILRGNPQAEEFVGTRLRSGRLKVHAAVAAEIVAGARNRVEVRQITKLIDSCRSIVPTAHDWESALQLCGLLRPTSGIDWVDCLVASTALRLDLPVATINDKHFARVRGLQVIRPY